MPEDTVDLISMADIARLAGQSRATVGNWKRREADFPVEHSRGTRGPLYDRSVIEAWLADKGRLSSALQGEFEVFRVTDRLRGDASVDDVQLIVFVLLALRTVVGETTWLDLVEDFGLDLVPTVTQAINEHLPEAADLLPMRRVNEQVVWGCVEAVTRIGASELATTAEVVLDALFDAAGRRWGEWASSASLRSLMVAVAGWGETVYDPAAGTGRLLVDMATPETALPQQVFGQEVNADALAIGRLNLVVHHVSGRVEGGDVLREDKFIDLRFDRVVADPPWHKRPTADWVHPDDPRWIWGDPGSSDASMAWVQHCLFHLKDGGRAVVVVPPKVLFAAGRAALPMQGIIKSGFLDAVISLPAGLLAARSLRCALLVFVKGRAMERGRPAPTLMVNIEDDQARGSGRVKELPPDLITEIGQIYEDWQDGIGQQSAMVGVAEYDDMARYEFDLTPRRYLETPVVTYDPAQLAEAHREMSTQVAAALDACRRTDAELLALLQGDR